jgi:glycine oxidase
VEFQGPPGTFVNVVWSERGYVVPRLDGRVLAGSTSEDAGFDRAVTAEAREELTSMALEIAPVFSTMDVISHWSGLRPFAPDALPVIGPVNGIDGLTVTTAHYRNGILLAPITGNVVAGMVLGPDEDREFSAFSPNRFRSAAASI